MNAIYNRTLLLTVTFNLHAAVGQFCHYRKMQNLKNDWNPGKLVLIREYTARAIQLIPAWQGLDGFQKSLRTCALDESSLSIRRVKDNLQWKLALWISHCVKPLCQTKLEIKVLIHVIEAEIFWILPPQCGICSWRSRWRLTQYTRDRN